jgi:hypothetical protein
MEGVLIKEDKKARFLYSHLKNKKMDFQSFLGDLPFGDLFHYLGFIICNTKTELHFH